MSAEARLKQLGIELPPVPQAAGNYVHAMRTGNLLYLSGKGASRSTGPVGAGCTIEEAYQDAREVGLILLAVMRESLGSLDRVKQVVKLVGMVNGAPDFGDHPKVVNGCSDVLVEVLGDAGRHARAVLGTGSLPGRIAVAVDAIIEIEADPGEGPARE